MPAKRELSMRQLRHLLRLTMARWSAREIGRRLGVARSTVQDNLKRATVAGSAWPLADDMTDDAWNCCCSGAPESRLASGVGSSRIGRPWRAS